LIKSIGHIKNNTKNIYIPNFVSNALSETDISWILSTFAHLRCFDYFLKASDTFIAKEAANWCGISLRQLTRDGVHQDKRLNSSSKKKTLPEKYKEVTIDVIS
jgi:hypothetical protein